MPIQSLEQAIEVTLYNNYFKTPEDYTQANILNALKDAFKTGVFSEKTIDPNEQGDKWNQFGNAMLYQLPKLNDREIRIFLSGMEERFILTERK